MARNERNATPEVREEFRGRITESNNVNKPPQPVENKDEGTENVI